MKNKTLRNVLIVLGVVALIGCIGFISMYIKAGRIVIDTIDDAKLLAAKSETTLAVAGINKWCAVSAMKSQLDDTIDICEDGVTVEETKSMIEQENIEVLDITFENGKVTYLKAKSNKITIEYNGNTYEMVK